MMNLNIKSLNISIGKNSIIHPSARIEGINGKAKSIVIGDNCFIGENVLILCDEFSLGDYSKIQNNVTIHGYLPCDIGHNAWIGQYTIIDSIGGMEIGNNVGIGAHSQLWSHIKFGDQMEGCKFLSEKQMKIGNDVWFVGHCIVSPIIAEDKSMAMAGSVITKDMKYNSIYAGAPAKSISDKIGFQFKEKTIDEKLLLMNAYFLEFIDSIGFDNNCNNSIKIVMDEKEIIFENSEISYFNIRDRRYTKRNTNFEIQFMKFLLPEKAKFIPYEKF
jgi:acetyltransferase-like isoleucine patch superfamily enzyme